MGYTSSMTSLWTQSLALELVGTDPSYMPLNPPPRLLRTYRNEPSAI